MNEEKLTRGILGCVFRVHRELGPGFLETVYRRAMVVELARVGLRYWVEKEVVVFYDGVEVGRPRMDLVVEEKVILELKAVEELNKDHYAQTRSYLKATGLPLALLINFSKSSCDFRRIEPAFPISPQSPK